MPIFKTTKDIILTPWQDELFDENWMNSDKLILPETQKWDYSREMKIEDVDIWEQIYFQSGGTGLFAAWMPYAEFYLVINNIYWRQNKENGIETYYGRNSGKLAYKRCLELGMPVKINKIWVEPEDMWLYEN